MADASSRLERALELFCAHQQSGGDLAELIARHPDLAEELASFRDEADGSAAAMPVPVRFPADFEPIRELGRGGVGVVYEARQHSVRRRVALKLLHEQVALSPAVRARFLREAQTLAQLQHPSIVRVLAADVAADPPWLAMEFVEARSLAGRLDELRASGHRGSSIRELVEITAQIAEALHHAHRAGIVHRDVKPSNILCRADGSAVLTDFGIARGLDAPTLTRTGVTVGTPAYMAPERILGGDDDPRSDVCSLGLTLYECLALRRAYDGQSSQEVLQRILTEDAPALDRIVPGLPAELCAIVHRAIEREPAARYETAQAFADDLRAFLDLRPVQARPLSRGQRLWRTIRRRPWQTAAAALLIVTLALGAGFAWRWPQLAAAALAARAEQAEAEVALGAMVRLRENREIAYAHFRRAAELVPEDDVPRLALLLSIQIFEGAAQALAAWDAAVDPDRARRAPYRRLRTALLRGVGREQEAADEEASLSPARGWLELWLEAMPLLQRTKDREAVRRGSELLLQAMLVSPRPYRWLYVQYAYAAVTLDDRGSRRAAAAGLLALWPDDPGALGIAGACLLVLDPEQAERVLQRAFDTGTADVLTPINLAVVRLLLGRREQAVELLAATFDDPRLDDARRQRILELLEQAKAPDVATACAERWLSRAPGHVTARRQLARAKARGGDVEAAVAMLRECAADAPGAAEVRQDLAFALLQAGDAEAARGLLVALVAEQPDHAWIHSLLLDVCRTTSDDEGLLAEHERWVHRPAADGAAWREFAQALLAGGVAERLPQALEAAERADYLAGGRDPAALHLRAEALARLGSTAEAARLRARAAAIGR